MCSSDLLPKTFFENKTLVVAKELIGKYLVRKVGNKITREKIVETEAYVGPHDLACKSSRGKTEGNKIMYEEAGTIYVYFTYGMHWMLNVVTEAKDFPSAVLIRGTEITSGPARLTKALKIDKKLNGLKLGEKSGLWIEEDLKADSLPAGRRDSKLKISKTPRIGIDSAGPIWANKPYRFILR